MTHGVILAAGVVSGLAVWCSNGSLERVVDGQRTLRIALLPSLWTALACCLLSVSALYALVRGVRRVARPLDGLETERAADADPCLPALAAGGLVLPYLPHLADWFPALTVLAGPFKWVVWASVLSLMGRAAVLRVRPVTWIRHRAVPAALVFSAGVALYGAVGSRLIDTALFPGGDEPHYLVIAQSLWRDGDLRIENNHKRGDTYEYFRLPLAPHYLTRGKDLEIYSIHPIGLAVAAAPIYAIGGYHGVVAALVIAASLAGLCAWQLARRSTSTSSATVGWLACATGAPYVFNSFTVYPEVPGALAAVGAFLLATRLDRTPSPMRSAFACGLALAALPWLSSKYAAMAGAIGVVAILRIWFCATTVPMAARIRALALLSAPPAVSLALWFAFFYVIWGTFSPSAPYGSQRAMRLGYLAAGGPGLFFDQEYGIVVAGPALVLAFAGLVSMLSSRGQARRLGLEIAVVVVALLLPVGAFHQWWGGTSPVGRPLVAALLLFTVPVAWLYEQARERPALRAAAWLLVAGSLGITATLALAQQGLLIVGERDGISRLLDWWSPGWPLVAIAPSFVAQTPHLAATEAGLWVATLGAALLLLARSRRDLREGRAGLLAFGVAVLALSAVTLAVPLVPGREGLRARDLSGRAKSELLLDYDERRLPIGIIYSPFRVVAPATVASRVRFSAGPEPRGERTEIPLLYQARWSLPAGDYRLDLRLPGADQRLKGKLALQLGRLGGPVKAWDIDAGPLWTTTFTLPLDVGFVGFRASDELAALRPVVSLEPTRITSAGDRPPELEVLQTRDIGGTIFFFHDDATYPETSGMWLKADATTRFTIAGAPGTPIVVRLRAGAVPTSMEMRVDGRRETISLTSGQIRDIALPAAHRPRRIELTTRGGFVPAEVAPDNKDTRQLACWLEIGGP